MFIVSKKKYDNKVKKYREEIESLTMEILAENTARVNTETELKKLKKDSNNKESEIKQQKIIISQYEIKAKKDNEKIEKLSKEIDDLKNKNLKIELLRRKSSGKLGGLTAALNKKSNELKSLTDIISKQEEEIKKLKTKICPPTKQELENYKLFGNKTGRRK